MPKPMEPMNPLTYASRGSESRWVTLGKFKPLEADLVQVKLQSEGIPCNLADQNMAQIYSGVIGLDVRVEVLADQLDQAREVLEAVREERVKNAQRDPYLDEPWQCSHCRGRNIGYVPLSPPMQMLSVLLIGLPLLFISRKKRCNDCGHTWTA